MNMGKASCSPHPHATNAHSQRLLDWLAEYAPYEKLAIVHAGVQEEAEALREQVRSFFPESGKVSIVQITPVLGAHLGIGALGLPVFQRNKFMKIAKIISILGMLAMTAVLIYGFTVGDFFGEGSQAICHAVGHRLARGFVHGLHPLLGVDHLPRKVPARCHPVDNRHDDLRILRWQFVCLPRPAIQRR